jgi:hypothetical protein
MSPNRSNYIKPPRRIKGWTGLFVHFVILDVIKIFDGQKTRQYPLSNAGRVVDEKKRRKKRTEETYCVKRWLFFCRLVGSRRNRT